MVLDPKCYQMLVISSDRQLTIWKLSASDRRSIRGSEQRKKDQEKVTTQTTNPVVTIVSLFTTTLIGEREMLIDVIMASIAMMIYLEKYLLAIKSRTNEDGVISRNLAMKIDKS